MTYKEKRLEEFDEAFRNSSWWEDAENNKHSSAHSIRKFLSTSIHQALAEDRERVREYLSHYKTKSDCCSQTVDDIYTNLSSLDINNNH